MTEKELKEVVLDMRGRVEILLKKGGVNLAGYIVKLEYIGENVHLSIKSNDEEDNFYEEAESRHFDDAWQMLIGKLYIGTIFAE